MFHAGHCSFHSFANLHRIAAGLLIDDYERCWFALEERAHAVGLAAQRNVGHVAQPDLLARSGRSQYDVAELFGCGELRRQRDRIGIGRAVGSRLRSELARRVDAGLLVDGLNDFRNGYAVIFQYVGPQPDAHSVFASAHDVDLADTVDFQQFVLQVDIGVVRQEFVVESAVAVQGIDQQESRHGFACGDALPCDGFRELRCGCCDIVLGENRIQIGVGTDVECHLYSHRAVVGARRLHVKHVADPHDGLSDGRCDRIVDRLGIGAHVGGRHFDDRWGDVGILFDRQPHDGTQPQQHECDSQRNGEDGPRNEEFFHVSMAFSARL